MKGILYRPVTWTLAGIVLWVLGKSVARLWTRRLSPREERIFSFLAAGACLRIATLLLALVLYVHKTLSGALTGLSGILSRLIIQLERRVQLWKPQEHWLRLRVQALVDHVGQPCALILLILQPLVFFRHVLFNPSAHIPFDIEAFHLPLASYIARSLREGILPLWDPYQYCGVPIHADVTAQLFYPFTWISIILGNLSAGHRLLYWIEWLVPLHMILAGLFTFFLLRQLGVASPSALFGGTVYQLGGFFASQAQHLGAICSAAWLPLALLCVLKLTSVVNTRWIAVLALSVALSVLAGFPATTAITFGAVALLAIGLSLRGRTSWKFAAALLAAFVLGNCIAAVQIIPTYQLTQLSIASMRSQWNVTGGGLRLQSLVSLVVPNYYHIFTPFDPSLYRLPINFTFLYVYCGLITPCLLILAPFLNRAGNARMLFLFTAISAIWMLGDDTPLYSFVYTHLPRLVRSALYAEFALLAFCMFAALTAGITLQYLAAYAPNPLIWAIALLAAVDLIHFGADRPMNSMPGGYKQENSEYGISGYPAGSLMKIRNMAEVTNPPLRIDYLDTDPWTFVWGADMLKLPTADGNNPFMLRRLYLLRRIFGCKDPWEREIPVCRPTSPLVRMLNIGFLAGHSAKAPDNQRTRLTLGPGIAGLQFYRVSDPLPRFYLVHRLRLTSGPEATFAYLADHDFDPAEEAVVEADGLRQADTLGGGEVRVARYSPNRIELSVVAIDRAFLASSETLYPGWTATVNGKPAHLYMSNGAFRGIMLNRGLNQVVMTYWPQGFLIWATISSVSAIAAVAGVIFGRGSKQQCALA